MGYTKRQFVVAAFEEVGLASYVFDLTAEELQSAMSRMDAMMATWNGKGIRIGYPIPSEPENNSLDEETGVPDSANEAIILNLGIRIAPSFGKIVSQDTKMIAKQAYNVLLARATFPPQQQFPSTLPMGAGNKHRDEIFMPTPTDPLLAGQDGEIEFT